MCGRFITTGTWAEYRRYMDILPPEVEELNGPIPNYNVAPTTELDILTHHDGQLSVRSVKWGLVPHWAKDNKIRAMINARGETVAEKPFFRTAFEYGRCLIPANGYYEWKTENKIKQPHLIHLPGDAPSFEPFAFAGLMAYNKALESTSFAIITLAASTQISDLHDRMPVILKNDVLSAWMDPQTGKEAALEILQSNRGEDLTHFPVSKSVGNVQNKSPDLILPAA